MTFRAMPKKIPGFGAEPQGGTRWPTRETEIAKFTNFAIRLLTQNKTVAPGCRRERILNALRVLGRQSGVSPGTGAPPDKSKFS